MLFASNISIIVILTFFNIILIFPQFLKYCLLLFVIIKQSWNVFLSVFQRGPQGPQGQPGPPGPSGMPGSDGIDVSIHIYRFARQVCHKDHHCAGEILTLCCSAVLQSYQRRSLQNENTPAQRNSVPSRERGHWDETLASIQSLCHSNVIHLRYSGG